MIYQWKPGRHCGVQAQIAGDRIEAIRTRQGKVTPAIVVKDARPASSPLHPCFEWDNAVAADQWRIDQARDLLGSLVIIDARDPKGTEPVRAFIAIGDRGDEAADFMAHDHVMGDSELRARALKMALEDFRLLRQRYNRLSELSKVWAAVEQVGQGSVTPSVARSGRG